MFFDRGENVVFDRGENVEAMPEDLPQTMNPLERQSGPNRRPGSRSNPSPAFMETPSIKRVTMVPSLASK